MTQPYSDSVKWETKLKVLIDDTEDKYFSGVLNAEQAKQLLDLLK